MVKTCQAFVLRQHLHWRLRALRCNELCPEIVIMMTMMLGMRIRMTIKIKDMRKTNMKRSNLHGPNMEVNVVAVQIIGDVTAQPGPSLLIIIII